MSRTAKYKLFYFLALFGILAIVLSTFSYFKVSVPVIVIVAFLFLIPGRIQGYFYRDFFRGRNLLTQQNFEDAIPHFEQFLQRIEKEPQLQQLSWLSGMIYTRSIKAMTLNNLGAAYLGLGKLQEAEDSFNQALKIDGLFPLPFYNLALVQQVLGEKQKALSLLEKARGLGLENNLADKFIQKSGELLASVEGRIAKP